MRILLCHSWYREEGGENILFRSLLSILRNHGEEVLEYTRDNKEIDKFNLLEIGRMINDGLYSHRTIREIRRLVSNCRPDVAVVQNVLPLISPSIYLGLKQTGIPIVQLVYNYRFVCPNAHLFVDGNNCERCVHGNTAHAFIHRCIRHSYSISAWYALILGIHRSRGTFSKSISRFIVPDEYQAEMLSRGGFSRERIHVNSNPLDISNYYPGEEFDDYVLFVGRFVPQKGAMILVEAMNQVRSPIRALLVGSGETEDLVKAARGNSRVCVRGPVFGDEKKQLIARALAVVIPSIWHDNIPAILTEAFATGKPVIASDIQGLSEGISDGHDGLLFRTGDAADLAAKIDMLASKPALARQMGQRARVKVQTEWSETAYYTRLRGVLDLAIGNLGNG